MSYVKKFMAARLKDPIDINLLNRMLNSIEEEFKLVSKGIASHAPRHQAGGGDEIDHDLLISTLIGYWPFNKGSGMVAYDKTKYGNNGSLENMEEGDWVDGKLGKALEFDGVSEYVNLPASQIFAQQKMTISAWINANNFNTYRGLIYINEQNGTDYFIIRCDGDGLTLLIEDDNVTKVSMATAALAISDWIHVVFTQDGTGWKFYLNGDPATFTGTNSAYCTDHLTAIIEAWIGRGYWADEYFSGKIDEVRIYRKALTAEEVKAFYDTYS